ncbi:hypothetical protein HII31_02714 [Pseudocercospora fuligena]|uniref:Uncharacterized protein n=1 Tax=Pseudocercospora fuligena TaxID=685502 RepID=A0A8H6RSB2_9PEZI|nr:hypothetical protein HII31_02714 [Pseudocercospora fuligena]
MADSEPLLSLDCSEEDDCSLSSYTVYSSAASDDNSPAADEKRRIRRELDDAAFADIAKERAEQERTKEAKVQEKQQRHRELFNVLEQWAYVVATALPYTSIPERRGAGDTQEASREGRVEVLEEYYYDAETRKAFQRPVTDDHSAPAKTIQVPPASLIPVGPQAGFVQSDPGPVEGSSTRMIQHEPTAGCEICFSVPICSIHGKGKWRI